MERQPLPSYGPGLTGTISASRPSCPVANQVSAELGASWKRRRVAVYVADEREASRVSKALDWPTDALVLDGSSPTRESRD